MKAHEVLQLIELYNAADKQKLNNTIMQQLSNYKLPFIAAYLNMSIKTIYTWSNTGKTNNKIGLVPFLKLLDMLKLDPLEFLKNILEK
jgi:hypothetical protein